MEKILDIAKFLFDEYKKLSGEAIDEMKLHKLLYFAQREALAITGKPLFRGEMQGWKYGPVSPELRSCFAKDGLNAKTEEIGPEAAYIAKNVLLEYGSIASWRLSELTHKEISWINAREGLSPEDSGNEVIKLEDIRKDAEKVRPYDHVWDMYYDEFDDLPEEASDS